MKATGDVASAESGTARGKVRRIDAGVIKTPRIYSKSEGIILALIYLQFSCILFSIMI